MTTTANIDHANIAEITRVLLAAGDYFHGGDVADTAAEWDAHDFTAAGVEQWIAIGVWDSSVANQLDAAGLRPRKVVAVAESMVEAHGADAYTEGCPIYAACNGDLSPQAIVDAWQAM